MRSPQATPSPTGYPPEPWRLRGELQASLWLVPRKALAFQAPAGWRPVTLLGRCLVGAAWAHYRPGGDLSYRELAVGIAVRRGLRLAVTLPWIWVDDPRSLAGGRQLWAIPKKLARFGAAGELSAQDCAGAPIAESWGGRARALPGRWPAAFTIAQAAQPLPALTPARFTARLGLRRSRWRAASPLEFLDGRRPLLTLRLERAALRFGPKRKT